MEQSRLLTRSFSARLLSLFFLVAAQWTDICYILVLGYTHGFFGLHLCIDNLCAALLCCWQFIDKLNLMVGFRPTTNGRLVITNTVLHFLRLLVACHCWVWSPVNNFCNFTTKTGSCVCLYFLCKSNCNFNTLAKAIHEQAAAVDTVLYSSNFETIEPYCQERPSLRLFPCDTLPQYKVQEIVLLAKSGQRFLDLVGEIAINTKQWLTNSPKAHNFRK